MSLAEMVAKLGLALVLGGLVGIERERRERPAGLRTHILVCVGSTLITLVSLILSGPHADRTRIAAQIVSGIGFLGAGTIFRAGTVVKGLTTAAGLWVVAGIGMAVAAGGPLLILAVVTACLVFIVNNWLRRLEDQLLRVHHEVVLVTSREHDVLPRLLEGLAQQGVAIEEVEWLQDEAAAREAVVRFRLRLPPTVEKNTLTAWMSAEEGVRQVTWE